MNSVNVLQNVLYLLLYSSGESGRREEEKRMIRHMQLYFSLCESKNKSMTVSSTHKTAFTGGRISRQSI